MKNIEYKKNLLPVVPSWQHFIFVLNYKFNNPNLFFNHEDKCLSFENKKCSCFAAFFIFNKNFITDILIRENFDIVCWNIADYKNKNFLIPEIKNLVDFYSDKLIKNWDAKMLVNFVSNEYDLTLHKDDHDVISWQCQGSVEYRIYENLDGDFGTALPEKNQKYISYILNPGDVMYIPKGVAHKAVVLEPRATIILNF